MEPAIDRIKIPEKLFFKIGEISEILQVEPYVLRYWESEFPFLRPKKNKAGHRVYTKKNLELIIQVRNLLYKEKYTIAGVKKRFAQTAAKNQTVSSDTIEKVRKGLKEVLKILSR